MSREPTNPAAPPGRDFPRDVGAADAVPSERIGPYRLLRVLGEGGMGIVYEAEQLEPVHRRVAVKMVRAGMATSEVLARFEAERQALAVMDHPGIARVLDAGAAASGSPYFVMELVKGVALLDYCDANRLTLAERVRIFIQICQAVQHAHQKGVIHRDLKPSNVLVAEQDGPLPKIIDFGIAKALSQRLTERTLVTAFGQSVGTPAYMSPEQAEATGLDVDTRSDIYSLGVILYELLVGRLPVDPEELGLSNFILALTGRANDPPRPSVKLAQMREAAGAIAALRRTDVASLRKQLAGDLDWIVMKAIEKDRNRRYETANALATDLQRYLASEPVVARPPSAGYRLRKLVKRNRASAVAVGLLAVSIVAGGSLATVGFVKARRAEAAARREARVAARTSDFLVRLFAVSNPNARSGTPITARELLDSGAARIDRELDREPRVKSRMLRTMGTAYSSLGLFDRSESLLRRALELDRTTTPVDSASLAESYFALGSLVSQKGSFAAAESLLTAAAAIHATLRDAPDSVYASDVYELARLAWQQGHPGTARARAGEVLARLARSGDSVSSLAINSRVVIGISLVQEEKYDSAAVQFRAAIAAGRPLFGESSGTVMGAVNNLALSERHLGHYAVAESLLVDVLPRVREIFGSTSVRYGIVLDNLGAVYNAQRRWSDAAKLFTESMAINDRMLDPTSPDRASTMTELGKAYAGMGRLTAADSLFRRALALQTRAYPPDSPEIAETAKAYAPVLRELGRVKEAEEMERRAAKAKP